MEVVRWEQERESNSRNENSARLIIFTYCKTPSRLYRESFNYFSSLFLKLFNANLLPRRVCFFFFPSLNFLLSFSLSLSICNFLLCFTLLLPCFFASMRRQLQLSFPHCWVLVLLFVVVIVVVVGSCYCYSCCCCCCCCCICIHCGATPLSEFPLKNRNLW